MMFGPRRGVVHAVPTVSALSPSLVPVGSTTTVTVTGTGFDSASAVLLDGTAQATTYVDATHVTFSIAPAAVATRLVSVQNPAPGGGTSGTLPVYVQWTADFSTLTPGAISAATLLATGSGGYVLTRASAATVMTSAIVIDSTPGVDVPCVGNLGVGGTGLVIREARTNSCKDSRVFAGTGFQVITAGNTVTPNYVAGPDGNMLADRVQLAQGFGGSYIDVAAAATNVQAVLSAWCRAALTTSAWVMNFEVHGASTTFNGVNTTVNTTWRRGSASAVGRYAVFICAHNNYAGTTEGARDVVLDFLQIEVGAKGALSAIITAGATGTRAGERLRHATPANLLDGGRLGRSVKLYPMLASTEYTANYRLWTIDASNYAEVNFTTRVVTVVVGGTSRALPTAIPAFAALDTIELWVAAGGGTLATVGTVKINGTVTDLGSVTAHAAISPGANPLEVNCAGTSSVWSAILATDAYYPAGQKPAFAIAA